MTTCIVCSKPIDQRELFVHPVDKTSMHSTCSEVYTPGQTPPPAQASPPRAGQVSCQQCGSEMVKTKKTERSMALQLVGVILFFVGVALLFVVPIGTAVGLVLMIVAARLGYSQKKVWKCKNCGYFFERA